MAIRVRTEALHPDSLRSYGIPTYWQDETFRCVDCGEIGAFSAIDQRDWYEVKKRPIFVRPIRCVFHHERWRQTRRAKFAMDRLLGRLEENPDDLGVARAAALAITRFHRRTGRGNLNLALHLLRSLKTHKATITEEIAYCEAILRPAT